MRILQGNRYMALESGVDHHLLGHLTKFHQLKAAQKETNVSLPLKNNS